MMRKCHLNTCPVGIATQDEELEKIPWQARKCCELPLYGCERIENDMAKLGIKKGMI